MYSTWSKFIYLKNLQLQWKSKWKIYLKHLLAFLCCLDQIFLLLLPGCCLVVLTESISQSVNQWMKMFLTIYFPLKQQRGRMFPFSKTAFLLFFFFKLQRKLTSCPSLFWDVSLNGQRLNEKAIFFIEEHKMLGWPNRCIRFTKIRKHCPLFKVNQKENTFSPFQNGDGEVCTSRASSIAPPGFKLFSHSVCLCI